MFHFLVVYCHCVCHIIHKKKGILCLIFSEVFFGSLAHLFSFTEVYSQLFHISYSSKIYTSKRIYNIPSVKFFWKEQEETVREVWNSKWNEKERKKNCKDHKEVYLNFVLIQLTRMYEMMMLLEELSWWGRRTGTIGEQNKVSRIVLLKNFHNWIKNLKPFE